MRLPVRLRRGGTSALLLAPALLLIGVLFLYPLAKLVMLSFTEPALGVANYTAVVRDPTLWRVILITLEIAAECTAVTLVLAYPLASLIASLPKRPARVLLLGVLLPFWTSLLVRMYAWMVLLGRHGVINQALLASGIADTPLPLLYDRFAVLVGMSHYLLPFMVLSMYATMAGIDRRLLEAAGTMGSSGLQTFCRVYFPLSLPGVYSGALLVFILSLGFYVTPALLGGPADTTIPVYVEQQVELLNWGEATAMSMVLLVVVVLLFALYNRALGFQRMFRGVGLS